MKHLNRLFLILTLLLGGAILLGAVALYVQRKPIERDVLVRAEQQVRQATGLAVTVDRWGGPVWRGLVVEGVRIHGGPTAQSPTVLWIPRVRVSYSIWNVLRLKTGIQITLDHPVGLLVREADGRLDLHLRLAHNRPGGKPPRLPAIHLAVNGGTFSWLDRHGNRPAVQFTWRNVNGGLTYANDRLTFDGRAAQAGGRWTFSGAQALATGKGRLAGSVRGLPFPMWATYLAPSTLWQLQQGQLDMGVSAGWNLHDLAAMHVTGTAQLRDGKLVVAHLKAPVEKLDGTFAIGDRGVQVQELHGSVAGNPWGVKGAILAPAGWQHPPVRLALDFHASAVSLASMSRLLPILHLVDPQGQGRVEATVTGVAAHPLIAGTAYLSDARLLREQVTGSGTFSYQDGRLSITGRDLAINGGPVAGGAILRGLTGDAPQITANATFEGVDLARTLAPYGHVQAAGTLGGKVSVSGALTSLVAAGSTRLDLGRLGHQPIWAVTSFSYSHGRFALPDLVAGTLGGRLTGSASILTSGPFSGQFRLVHFPLSRLVALGVPVIANGTGWGDGTFQGNFRPGWRATLQARGHLMVQNAQVEGIPIDAAASSWRFGADRFELTQAQVVGMGGTVDGQGQVDLGQGHHPAGFQAIVEARGLHLEQAPLLQRLLAPRWGAVAGVLDARGSIREAAGRYQVLADVDVHAPSLRHLGALDEVAGPVAWEGTPGASMVRLGRARQPLSLRQAGNEVTVAGHWDLGAGGGSDLHAVGKGLHLAPWLSAVHWSDVLEGTLLSPGNPRAKARGSAHTVATLPAYYGGSGLDHVLAYFLAVRQSANPSGNPLLSSRQPFWQELDGRLDLDLRIHGPNAHLTEQVDANLSDGVAYQVPLRRATLIATYGPGHLRIRQLVIQDMLGRSLEASGTMEGHGISIVAHGLDLGWLDPWLAREKVALHGDCNLSGRVQGQLSDPAIRLTALVEGGAFNDFLYDQAYLRAHVIHGRVFIEDALVTKGGKNATISGTMPLWAPPTDDQLALAMHMEGESLGLLTIFTHDQVHWLGGNGSVDLTVGGTLGAPRIDGDAILRGVAIGVAALKDPVTDLDAAVSLDSRSQEIVIQSAQGETGGGQVEVNGFVTMQGFIPHRLNLQVHTTDPRTHASRPVHLVLTDGLFGGDVTSAVTLSGAIAHPVVSGIAAVANGTMALKAKGASGAVTGAGSAQQVASQIPLDFTDLTLVLGPNLEVTDNSLMDLYVRGLLQVNGSLADPVPSGKIRVVRGTITPFTNSFQVTKGEVDFVGNAVAASGADPYASLLPTDTSADVTPAATNSIMNAQVNMTAQTTAIDYDPTTGGGPGGLPVTIVADVTGTLGDMSITFTSPTAPQLSQDQLLAILGGGSFLTALSNSTTGAAGAPTTQQLLLQAGSGRLSSFINSNAAVQYALRPFEDLLGLSDMGFRLQVDPALTNAFGVTPEIYLTFKPLDVQLERARAALEQLHDRLGGPDAALLLDPGPLPRGALYDIFGPGGILGPLSLGLTMAAPAAQPPTYAVNGTYRLDSIRWPYPLGHGIWDITLHGAVGTDVEGSLGYAAILPPNQIAASALISFGHGW